MGRFLKRRKTEIVGKGGKPVVLRGVNLGGWLMMEAYILYAPNFPERRFRREFAAALGRGALRSFEEQYRRHFIREQDIRNIARLGFNCVRVPFHYRLVEKTPYRYDPDGARFLDRVIRWAGKHGVRVILDLHAAPGCQNHDWHSDSDGKAGLWTNKTCRDRTATLWEFLADRYRDEEYVAGYDLLNEAVLGDAGLLNRFYRKLIKRIRAADRNHILFIEGNQWARDVDCLEEFDDDNYALSVHCYDPLDFTFNFVPGLSYPLKTARGAWGRAALRRHLSRYKKISQKRGVPVFVGEFGVNARGGRFGEDRWLEDVLGCFRDFGFHWAYWTYKAVKNGVMPDGIYSYTDNPPWVNRLGPLTGWETYKRHWRARQRDMVRSWHTDRFRPNTEILRVLKNDLR